MAFRALAAPTRARSSSTLAYEFATAVLETLVGPVFNHIAHTFIDAFVRRAEAELRSEDVTVAYAAPGIEAMVPLDLPAGATVADAVAAADSSSASALTGGRRVTRSTGSARVPRRRSPTATASRSLRPLVADPRRAPASARGRPALCRRTAQGEATRLA